MVDRLSVLRAYMEDITKQPLLGEEEANGLFRKMEEHEEGQIREDARNKIVAGNLRLVVWIAKRYSMGDPHILSDYIQEGSLGLIKASEKYNPSKGYKFSTYAAGWIRGQILNYGVRKEPQIRMPDHLVWLRRRVFGVIDKYVMSHKGTPSVEQIHSILLSQGYRIDARPVTKTAIKRALDYKEAVSLSREVRYHDEPFLGDTSRDIRAKDITSCLSISEMEERVRKALDELPEKYRFVLKARYGFNGTYKKDGRHQVYAESLEQISAELGCTKQNVQLIERKGIKMLRKKLGRLVA